ncbi:MAG: Type 1 glutamine amidotransferase-like domain-containing protein [Actinomycetota bacterium]
MRALVGSGEYLPPMEPVDRELLELVGDRPRVVCLPTAAGTEGDEVIDDWMERGVEHFRRLGADADGVRVWDRASAGDPALVDRVAAADLVYLSGGRPSYLHASLVDTPTWRAITEVVERGGLLVGCSAGAMIQGEVFLGGLRPRPGFGLWSNVNVIPHYDEIPGVVRRGLRLLGGRRRIVVGVEADTALVDLGDRLRVVGGRVTVWSRSGRSTHGPGELPTDLLAS